MELPNLVEEVTENSMEMEYKLVPPQNEGLRTPSEKFNFQDPQINPVELYNILGKALIKLKGVGLSACQIGLPYHFFVLRTDPIIGMFNAEIVDESKEKLNLEEGCLSFPGIILKIKRPKVIRVRYTDPLGERKTEKFQDMTAKIIGHEIDHCNGTIFTGRTSRIQIERAIKKAKKSKFEYLIGDILP